MDIISWTITAIGIGATSIGILFSLFQYLNKKGSSKVFVVKKSLIISSGVTLILYSLGIVFWVKPENNNLEQLLVNTEIVLDCSESMKGQFDGQTKLEAAKDVISKILYEEIAEGDNLAFRKFGGPCDGKNNYLEVKFSTNNETNVRDALTGLEPSGKATLLDAIIEATGDFNNIEQFKGVNKRIIVVIGSGDSCVTNPEHGIRHRLKNVSSLEDSIELSFRFIGMGISSVQKNEFEKIASETGGDSKALFVDTKKDLENVLSKTLVIEPFVIGADTVLIVFNHVVTQLDEIIVNLNQQDFLSARNKLEFARKEFERTNIVLQELVKRQRKGKFYKLLRLAKSNKDEQKRLIKLSETMLELVKEGKISEYNKLTSAWNKHRDTYNRQITEINKILNELRNQN